MRIIGGKFGGRKFNPPAKNWPTRPTTDISKEALFNILNNLIDFEEVRFLDLFGGTGNHCYEMISRGCRDATYVDRHYPAVKFVLELSKKLGTENNLTVKKANVKWFIENTSESYDYIFAGPPYGLEWLDNIPDMIFESNLLSDEGLLVLEHNPNHDFSNHPAISQVRKYGQTTFSFFG